METNDQEAEQNFQLYWKTLVLTWLFLMVAYGFKWLGQNDFFVYFGVGCILVGAVAGYFAVRFYLKPTRNRDNLLPAIILLPNVLAWVAGVVAIINHKKELKKSNYVKPH